MAVRLKPRKEKIQALIRASGAPVAFYEVSITGNVMSENPMTLCKEVSMPGLKQNSTDIWWKGVKYPIAREVQHEQTVELGFYQDLEDIVRQDFMAWMNNPTKGVTMTITQYLAYDKASGEKQVNAKYVLEDVFPLSVSDIKLGYDKASELGMFNVSLAYSIMKGA